MVELSCQDMQKKDQWKVMMIRDMDECKEVIGAHIEQAIFTFVVIYVLLAAHFQLVIYTHWKSFGQQNFQRQVDEQQQPAEGVQIV